MKMFTRSFVAVLVAVSLMVAMTTGCSMFRMGRMPESKPDKAASTPAKKNIEHPSGDHFPSALEAGI